jgi:hypothetical protein
VLFDFFFCCLKLFSEGENFGIEDQEFLNNSTDQGKQGHSNFEAYFGIA